jgi:hypothetical protein
MISLRESNIIRAFLGLIKCLSVVNLPLK